MWCTPFKLLLFNIFYHQYENFVRNWNQTLSSFIQFLTDNYSDLPNSESTESDLLYQQTDDYFTPNHSNLLYDPKTYKEDEYEFNLKSKTTAADYATLEPYEHSLLYNLFFSPFASIFLAAFINILSLANVDFTLYKVIQFWHVCFSVKYLKSICL